MSQAALKVIPFITKLSPSVLRVLGCNPSPMTLQGTNTYIIGTGQRRVLLDTGDGKQPDYLTNLKKSLDVNKITIGSVVISHWHYDHIGGLDEVLKLAEKDCQVFKFPRKDAAESLDFTPVSDGQLIQVDGATLKVVHTPGHTTDHLVLHHKEENSIFSGDCILGEGTTVFEDLFDYMKSLQIILDMNPSLIYPGHGSVIEDPIDRLQYYISHRNEREKQIYEALSKEPGLKMTPMDIVKEVYKDTPENLHLAASFSVSHHLKKMVKEGRVQTDEGFYWVKK